MGTTNFPNTLQLCLTVAMLSLQVTLTSSFPEHRQKRSLFQMCTLLNRHGQVGCYRYNGYGCFCGLGNAGEDIQPTDGIDSCCKKHDKCYGQLKCGAFQFAQITSYKVNCSGPDNWKYQCKCKDKRSVSPCGRSICDCDLQFARCVGRSTFNPDFEKYDRAQCKPIVRRHKSLRELRHFRRRNKHGRRRKGKRERKNGRRKNKKDADQRKDKKRRKNKKNMTISNRNTTTVEQSKDKSKKSSFWNNWFGWMG